MFIYSKLPLSLNLILVGFFGFNCHFLSYAYFIILNLLTCR